MIHLQEVHTARDGTCKMIFALNPDEGTTQGSVETVLIPMMQGGGNQKAADVMRYTACVSSQVGCAMNCQFCYTVICFGIFFSEGSERSEGSGVPP